MLKYQLKTSDDSPSPVHTSQRKPYKKFFDDNTHRDITVTSLPTVLENNSIMADKGLLQQAKQVYKRRKIALEKQIIFDNATFVTQQKILRLGMVRPEEIEK